VVKCHTRNFHKIIVLTVYLRKQVEVVNDTYPVRAVISGCHLFVKTMEAAYYDHFGTRPS
jgi:hypothetical protein